jgi:cytochrome c-type biogenesis protein CcmH/NrfF
MCRRLIASALLFASVVSFAALSFADEAPSAAVEKEAELQKKAHELYQQVLSPFCPGRSLNDCPSSKAQELKDELRSRLESGESQETILQDVFARFGDQYRAVPIFAGVGVFVWLVPIGFVVFGLTLAVLVSLGKKKTETSSLTTPVEGINESVAKRLADELKQLD